jgi:hypothetical protein
MKKRIWYLIAALAVLVIGGAVVYWVQAQSVVKTTTTSSQKKTLQGNVTSEDTKNKKTYAVTAADASSASYVSSGAASEVGQFTISAQGNRATLTAQSDVDNQLVNGDVTYTVTATRVMANSPKTDEALEMAQTALNSRDIIGDYTTLIVRYTIKNNSTAAIITDGVNSAGFADGSGVSVAGGLDNDASLSAQPIAAGASKETFVTLLVPQSQVASLHEVSLQFAQTFNASSNKQVSGASDKLTVNF